MYWCEIWTLKKASTKELMLLNCDVGEDSWEYLGLQGGQTSQSSRKSVLNIHLKGWCWSWNSNNVSTWCEDLTHLKRPWCWKVCRYEKATSEGWMASPTLWTWVWVGCISWWWTGKPGVLQSVGSQRVGHNWTTELNYDNNENNEATQRVLEIVEVLTYHFN